MIQNLLSDKSINKVNFFHNQQSLSLCSNNSSIIIEWRFDTEEAIRGYINGLLNSSGSRDFEFDINPSTLPKNNNIIIISYI